MILKGEYLHYELGPDTVTSVGISPIPVNTRIKASGDLVRAGIDFKFDFAPAPAPIVAKY